MENITCSYFLVYKYTLLKNAGIIKSVLNIDKHLAEKVAFM